MGYINEIRALIGSRPLIVVGACIFVQDREKRLLLVRRSDNGLWGLPAGTMELGETIEECARRELLEETGLKALRLEFFHVFSGMDHFHTYPNGDQAYIVSTAFRATEYEGMACVNDHESHEVAFFQLTELPAELNPPTRPVLKRFIEHFGSL
ncbi:MAG: NUDIX domain-containing protein [Candidatus Obscuribacterales bacterium]|nr:NUDIX domain-containing protein [Candidatus Obscuribacterales bacterium]